MITILIKEINEFFNSLIGYLVVGIFLIGISLIMWVLPGVNVLDYGYANMEPVFTYGPYAFMFLIPAVTMRSIAEEKRNGTIELLYTLPFRTSDIILGKFFGAVGIVLLSLIPTLLYFYTLYQLGNPTGNLDISGIVGSYIGLALLGSVFVAIGLFSSSISENQIVSFVVGALLCFVAHEGIQIVANMDLWSVWSIYLERLSINYHYISMSNGLLEFQDVMYFVGFICLMLTVTWYVLERKR